LNGAVYTDVGDAFTFDRRDFKLHAGAGAELRAEVVLGWILPTDLRLGCARGLERSAAGRSSIASWPGWSFLSLAPDATVDRMPGRFERALEAGLRIGPGGSDASP